MCPPSDREVIGSIPTMGAFFRFTLKTQALVVTRTRTRELFNKPSAMELKSIGLIVMQCRAIRLDKVHSSCCYCTQIKEMERATYILPLQKRRESKAIKQIKSFE
ncbi:hypothetical protein DPMN_084189 [Dreissena polymorpha]|uniref:Uncharacterized protein n=1 Tax=Dreissena polymorpha TaxID=45954 RepID=A0A9D4BKM1_DREPO|nr:hypothetical protein DPMN_084189 [Dreissena polymorpha]